MSAAGAGNDGLDVLIYGAWSPPVPGSPRL